MHFNGQYYTIGYLFCIRNIVTKLPLTVSNSFKIFFSLDIYKYISFKFNVLALEQTKGDASDFVPFISIIPQVKKTALVVRLIWDISG